MLRFEKIKEFKNLNAISRIIYSERHGMILSIPGGESGMKVHSFTTGKLLFQHRFGPNTIIGTTGVLFQIGRWVIIRYMQNRGMRTVYVWLAFDFETLSVKELLTENNPRGVGVIGRTGNRVVFSCYTGPMLRDLDLRTGKASYPGNDIMVFDLNDGSFMPMLEMSGLYPPIHPLGATRCFRSKGTVSSSGCYLRTSCAVDESGLPTTRETGELDHVEADFVRLCGSKSYLFLLPPKEKNGIRELLACDHDMRETSRFSLPPLPTGEIKYSYDHPDAVELRQPAAPGILLALTLFPDGPYGTVARRIRYLFFDQEFRTLLWLHEAERSLKFGVGSPYLIDGYIVRPLATGAELINTATGEPAEVHIGKRVPLFYPANGYCLSYGSPGVAFSLHEDPPSHVFWREFEGAPLCCGVVADSESASSVPPPPVPMALPSPPAARKRKKPDHGIPEIPERPGAHILCTQDAELSVQMKAFGVWLPFFRKGGVNLYGYIYNPSGEGDFSDAELKEMGNTREEIECIRLSATDDWHDPAALAADLRRCETLVPEKPRNSRSRKWILRELEHLIRLCDHAAAGLKVQLLAPPADCEDEDDWFEEGEEDEDGGERP